MLASPLPLLLAVLMATPAAAQQAEPPAPDFAAGFTKLVALGLPALDAHAQWSTLPDSYDRNGDYQVREILKTLKGYGWSLPTDTGKPLGLAAGAVATVDLNAAAAAGNAPPRGLFGQLFGGGGTRKPAALPAADLTKDVRTLIAALRKPNNDRDPFSSGTGTGAGTLLLLATQIYQNGHTALANDLAMALFELIPSRESAVDAAISILADHAYEAAAQAFFASGDWAAYHRALTELVAKFPRGWASREAVAMLLPQLAKQAAGEKPAVPSLPAIPLDPKAVAAIQQLAAKPEAIDSTAEDEQLARREGVALASLTPQIRQQVLASLRAQGMQRFRSSSSWLLDAPDPETRNSSPLGKLTSLGISALPALAALVDDPYLTHLPNENARNANPYYSSNVGDAERILRLHSTLNRPATRGELACGLLKAALPDASGNSSNSYDPFNSDETDPLALRELALTFWKDHPRASRDELAAVFLREGSTYQAQAAATLLASSTDPKAHQVLEAHILAADPAIAQYQCVKTYLSARKTAAKPFFDAFAKLVRSQTTQPADDDESNQSSYEIKQAGGPEKILKQLEALVTGKAPHAIAREIARAKPAEAASAIRALLELMQDVTPEQRLNVLLEGATTTADPQVRGHFLQATYDAGWEGSGQHQQSTKNSADRTLPEAELKIWQTLVADTRELPNNNNGEKSTLGDAAAMALEFSINSERVQAAYSAAPILQTTVTQLLRARATARLAGQPVPPLPDAARVTPERLRAIVTAAAAKPAPDIHPYLKTLTPDERAAWLTWSYKPGDLPAPQSVKNLRLLVIGRSAQHPGPAVDVPGAGNLDPGFTLTAANLKTQIKSIAADIPKHSRTMLTLHSATFGPGLEVFAQVLPLPEPKPATEPADAEPTDDDMESPPNRQPDARSVFYQALEALGNQDAHEAVILVRLANNRKNFNATWFVDQAQPKPADPETLAALESALQTLATTPEAQPLSLTLQILSKSDAEKIKEAQRD